MNHSLPDSGPAVSSVNTASSASTPLPVTQALQLTQGMQLTQALQLTQGMPEPHLAVRLSGRLPQIIPLLVATFCLVIIGAQYRPGLSYQQYREQKRTISRLSLGEREQLERSLVDYQKLSPDEQQKYWQLHQYIEDKNLQSVVREYNDWLGTLSPFERAELRQQTEPVARVAAVENIIEEHRLRNEYRLPELIARIIEQEESTPGFLRMLLRQQEEFDFLEPYILTESQLETIVNGVLLQELNSAQQQQLQAYQGMEKMFRILRASISTLNNPRESWPTDKAFYEMQLAGVELKDEHQGEPINYYGRTVPYEMWRRIVFRRLLIRSLMILEMQEFAAKNPVSENDLLKYFSQLNASHQATLLNTTAEYQADALKWYYIWEKHRAESVFNKKEFRDHVLTEMIPSLVNDWFRGGIGRNGERPAGDLRSRFGEGEGRPPFRSGRPGERPEGNGPPPRP